MRHKNRRNFFTLSKPTVKGRDEFARKYYNSRQFKLAVLIEHFRSELGLLRFDAASIATYILYRRIDAAAAV